MTREFHAPLSTYELSLPSGLINAGELANDAAIREFNEETEMTLSRVIHVSPPLASSAGLTDETVSLIYGEATGSISREHQTEHEDIGFSWLALLKFINFLALSRTTSFPAGSSYQREYR